MSGAVPERLLEAHFPSGVLEVIRTLRGAGFAAFAVGGCVRDLLLGKTPKDFDVATAAHPTDVQRLFKKVIPTGLEHGTVTVLLGGHPIEVTTFRTEAEYIDGRRPSRVEFHTEIEADLSRRDFTINAMAFDPIHQAWADPFGGQRDLEARLIRCVGAAIDRFSEDGLRALRAVRFATVLEFALDPATEAAIPQTLPTFDKIAMERVNQELVKLLLARKPGHGALLLSRTGLLGRIVPELGEVTQERAAALECAPATLEVRLAVLLHGASTPRDILIRLKFPTKAMDEVSNLLSHPIPLPGQEPEWMAELARMLKVLPPSDGRVRLRWWMSDLGRASVENALALVRALGTPEAQATCDLAESIAAEKPPLSTRDLALQGKQIMDVLGVGPSPKVGEASRFLLARVLEDPTLNRPDDLSAELRKWAKAQGL